MGFTYLQSKGLFLITLFIVTAILLGATLPGDYRLIHALMDSGHFLIFTLLSLIALWPYRKMESRSIWPTMLVCLLFGILIELVQSQLNRDPSFFDVMMDMLGISAGAMLYLGFIRRSITKGLTVSVVTVLAMLAFSQPIYWLIVYQARANEFPRLINLDGFVFDALIETLRGSEVHRIALTDTKRLMPTDVDSSSCAYVSLAEGRWPGISLREPEPDWRGYKSFELTIYFDQVNDLRLNLRINDQNYNYHNDDRFNRSLMIHSGYNHFSVPLIEIEHGPKARKLDLSNISRVGIIASQAPAGSGFCLVSMELR